MNIMAPSARCCHNVLRVLYLTANSGQVWATAFIVEGVNFIVKLRHDEDPIIQSLPVIFYAAYEWERLVEFTRPARERQPDAELSNTPKMLIEKTIRTLAYIRLHPVKKKVKKEATDAI